eukprot:jgi/Mesen1/3063/ME000018S02378
MAKGSQSQAAVSVPRGGASSSAAGRTGPPPGAVARGTAGAGVRRRRTTGGAGGGGFGGSGSNNMLRFYTDDAPGMKISPTVVLVMSFCFIAFVTVLHAVGKFYNHKSA